MKRDWMLRASFTFGAGAALAAALIQFGVIQLSGAHAVGADHAHPHDQDFHWTGALASGKSIEIKGVSGSVVARPASGREVDVTAEKSWRRSDPDDVRIAVIEHEGGVTVCAVYPSHRGRTNECAPGQGGRMSVQHNDVRVRFSVAVPQGVTFVGRTVNGSVDAQALASDVIAHTVNGDVDVMTTGAAEATTVNGSINAAVGRAGADQLSFNTVNGSITLQLPADFGAEVLAATVNGGLTTDFPLTVSGKWGPRRMSGQLGIGGPELRLKTVNGAIYLKKAE